MFKYSEVYLQAAHRKSYGNIRQIKDSTWCGCYFCNRVFQVSSFPADWLVVENYKNEDTLQCPFCFIDAVIGDGSGYPVTNPDFLQEMHQRWFDSSAG